MYQGLVVFDVDGVIFRDVFLKKMAQSKGLVTSVRMLMLGLRFYRGTITLDTLLKEGYRLLGHFDIKKAQEVARDIKIVTNINETIRILHDNRYYVSLISAGIPNFILKELADEIKADHFSGLDITVKDGTIDVEAIETLSKVDRVEELLKKLNIGWDRVFAVGDDPGNITLLERSKIGIGFNPTKKVRENSDIIVEGYDFLEILPYILPHKELPKSISLNRYRWRREIFRKGVHFLGGAFPFLARWNRLFTLLFLLGIMILYFLSELIRHMGLSFTPFAHITRRSQRHTEKKRIIMGPIFLGIGIALTILCFPFSIYLPSIFVVSISDSLAALIGQKYGRAHILGMKNRTIEGSTAFFLSSFIIFSLTLPLRIALPATLLATLLELIPFYDLDNIIIPFGTALFLHLLMNVMRVAGM